MEKITVDFNNMMVGRVGACHGVNEKEIEKLKPLIDKAFNEFEHGNWGFRTLPYDTGIVAKINAVATEVAKKYEAVVVIGIGGSSLGNRTLHNALNHPYYNMLSKEQRGGRPKVFVLENVDPDTVEGLHRVIDFEKTLFNVVTKSGGTAETMSNFMVLRNMLIKTVGEKKHKDHILVTTDPKDGTLRLMAKNEGYKSLEIPSTVGGRFSVFCSVGLFSAAVSGIDIGKILEGARYMDELSKDKDIWKNPGCMLAVLGYLMYKKKRTISVLIPYGDRLRDLSEWYAQLWAESLGKKTSKDGSVVEMGSTPVKALGVIDQHSQLQLYMEGPHDKVIRFIRIEEFMNEVEIPKAFSEYSAVNYLGGHSLNELICAEQKGTELALTKHSRPNCTVVLEKVTPFTIGALMYMMEVETAFIGQLFHIDPFDQPGVEESKKITYALLGRPGYEEKKKEIEELPKWSKKYSI